MTATAHEIDRVFGAGPEGDSPEKRAARSDRVFVRSQLQITFDNEFATGHRLAASEALNVFGWDVLKRVAEKGACALISVHSEPADTLQKRREELGLTPRQVANQAGIQESVVIKAETVGALSPIRDLELIGQALALNEVVLGHFAGAHGDHSLGVRLRESARATDAFRFTSSDVLALTEAAWIIAKYDWLASQNDNSPCDARLFTPSRDYRYRAYDRGYELAAVTRSKLGFREDEPITSLKSLAEERLGIPVIQQVLSDKFAGATIANGQSRGVVVNERGMNENVWVRRTTLAHEIGHLLWDPDEKLNRLKVDAYDDMGQGYQQSSDPVEIRANAFAVSFLAPPSGVRQIVSAHRDANEAVAKVMTTFGISATASKYHIRNICGIEANIPASQLPSPTHDWVARENLTVDFFRPSRTPISRRGQFAWLVISALNEKKISLDSAALYLKCSRDEVLENRDFIIDILNPKTRPSESGKF